ncbi:MAG: hypothetical protein M3066_19330 [Actinomycetota bacterium]|nr:hypothetical protein [Actinomycetota bacterium]
MRMGMYEDQIADRGDQAAPRDAARDGRAAAMSRRRALAAGRSALAPEQVRTGLRKAERRAPAAAVEATRPAADSKGAQGAPGATVIPTDAVAAGRLGRTMSMQRRRQLSKGKGALNGAGDDPTAAPSLGAPALIVYRGGAR